MVIKVLKTTKEKNRLKKILTFRKAGVFSIVIDFLKPIVDEHKNVKVLQLYWGI